MERHLDGWYRTRQRIRRAGHLASGAGIVLALLVIGAARPSAAEGWLELGFVTGSLGVLAVGAVVPRLLVQALWRLARWHSGAQWR